MKRTTHSIAVLFGILILALTACTATPAPQPGVVTAASAQATETLPASAGETAYPGPQATAAPVEPTPPSEATQDSSGYPAPQQPAVAFPTALPVSNVSAFPDPAGYTWQTVFSGLTRPTDLVGLGDGSGRLLVLEQPGVISLVQNDQVQPDPFLDLRDRVGSEANEQGLLGIALHPDFASNGFLYVNYTGKDGNTVISRFEAAPDRVSARADSEKVLLTVDQPYENHNGGGMAFGRDGYLYIGLGDGGSGGDPLGNGQNSNTLLGKLLRVDVNNGDPYAIPPGNAYSTGGGRAEIYALGLRNPWKFSFDRANGDLFIADVGQNIWEEVNFLPGGSSGGTNFGWNYREAGFAYEGSVPPGDLTLVDPVAQYEHPVGCSVTGGYVYRGEALPDFQGIYLYGDYCTGRIWGLLRGADDIWQNQVLFETGLNISSFGLDDAGEVYLLDHYNGVVLKLVKR
jgi:glucose/arabinose dehydrogenase